MSMAKVYRVAGYHKGRIEAPIEEVWELVNDWGTLHWFDDGTNSDNLKVMESWLEGEPGAVPRTRVMGRGEGAVKHGAPENNREVLLVSDPVAHRLYYDATDDFVVGIRNYMASWSFDELEDGTCMMTVSSNFDCVPAETGPASEAMLQQVYVNIVESLDKYFKKSRAKA
jgi:Polyketide cyclase / dehydrase and lipid transport